METKSDSYVPVKNVAESFAVTVATIWRWSRETDFPKPFRLNGATRWRQSEISAWAERQRQGGA